MASERQQKIWFRVHLALYIIYFLAYLAGVLTFALEYNNYWATAGFSVVMVLIAIRIALYVTPQHRLYEIFAPGGLTRILFQAFFFCVLLTFFALGLWMMARGIMTHQSWTGDSYFCGMTGMWMAAKWAYFVTVPLYELREDTLSTESLFLLGMVDSGDFNCNPHNTEPTSEKKSCA